MHSIVDRVVARDGQAVIRPVMVTALTYAESRKSFVRVRASGSLVSQNRPPRYRRPGGGLLPRPHQEAHRGPRPPQPVQLEHFRRRQPSPLALLALPLASLSTRPPDHSASIFLCHITSSLGRLHSQDESNQPADDFAPRGSGRRLTSLFRASRWLARYAMDDDGLLLDYYDGTGRSSSLQLCRATERGSFVLSARLSDRFDSYPLSDSALAPILALTLADAAHGT